MVLNSLFHICLQNFGFVVFDSPEPVQHILNNKVSIFYTHSPLSLCRWPLLDCRFSTVCHYTAFAEYYAF